MPTVIEQCIHALAIADLTHLSFLIRNLPVRNSFTPLFTALISTDVFISCPLLDKDALAVFLVFQPAAGVHVAVGVDAFSFWVGGTC